MDNSSVSGIRIGSSFFQFSENIVAKTSLAFDSSNVCAGILVTVVLSGPMMKEASLSLSLPISILFLMYAVIIAGVLSGDAFTSLSKSVGLPSRYIEAMGQAEVTFSK